MENGTYKTETSFGWLVILLIFIVVLGAIFGLGNGFNNGRDNGHCHNGGYVNTGVPVGFGYTSNCEVEKQTIINTATTQNLINTQAEATRAQASRIYEAQQAEKMFDLKLDAQTSAILRGQELAAKDAEIALLKQNAYIGKEFDVVNRELYDIRCKMLVKPELFGIAATCSGQTIPDLS